MNNKGVPDGVVLNLIRKKIIKDYIVSFGIADFTSAFVKQLPEDARRSLICTR